MLTVSAARARCNTAPTKTRKPEPHLAPAFAFSLLRGVLPQSQRCPRNRVGGAPHPRRSAATSPQRGEVKAVAEPNSNTRGPVLSPRPAGERSPSSLRDGG